MLFVEFRFFPFFLAVFGVYWLLRNRTARKVWLLAASYFFYASWDWRFLSLILTSTLVDYTAALRIARPGSRKTAWLVFSLVTNLGLLAVFKYFGFFVESAVGFLQLLGFEPHVTTLSIVLPVGISFYTFQTLSYTIDVHGGRLAPTRKLLDLALFVAFFPQLVAGPIVRARDFLPQLRVDHVFARTDVRAALVLFLVGFFKKACIADQVAPIVDAYYADPAAYDVLAAWTAVLFFPIQLYCDFSGYSDMAIACAALLGYRLCVNFHFPFFAVNLADFWRRWHISLSSWVRDYLFLPLGGSRHSAAATYRNLFITFSLLGLWHGAGWNFVLFGVLHGVGMVVRLAWSAALPEGHPARVLAARLSTPITMYFFVTSLIVFRAESFPDTGVALRAALALRGAGENFGWVGLAAVAAMGLVHWISYRRTLAEWWRRLPTWAFAAGYGAAVAVVLAFVPLGARPFVYFQF